MEAKKLAADFARATSSAVEAFIEGHRRAPGVNGDDGKDGPLLVSPFDLRVFAKAIANNLAAGFAHRTLDEDHCSDCGEELDAELVFVLRNGKRLHPGCV